MTSWLTLNAIAAERGDGPRPELRMLLSRSTHSDTKRQLGSAPSN
jgi:hypothetical protein